MQAAGNGGIVRMFILAAPTIEAEIHQTRASFGLDG